MIALRVSRPFLLVVKVKRVLHALLTDAFVSWRNVIRQGRRSLASAAAVVFGTVALILAAGFIQWMFWAMRQGTIYSGLGHIQVMRGGFLEHGTADPFRYLLPENTGKFTVVEGTPHVVSVAPRIKFTGLISHGEATSSFLGQGLDPAREVGAKKGIVIDAGEPLSNADPQGIVLGRGLATSLGVNVGDMVVLLVNRRDGTINGAEARVRGIFSTMNRANDDVALRVPLALASTILQVHGAQLWVVYLDKTSNTRAVVRFLRGRLGPGFHVVPWYDAADFYNKTVKLFSRQVLVMKVIIALVVILSISNTMMMAVIERTEEIATSMALGLRRARILGRFLGEGILIGLIGGVIGVVLGYVLAAGISEVGIPMPPPPGMAQGYVGRILVTTATVGNALALAGITALGASLYPAWKASRMVIADALRHGR